MRVESISPLFLGSILQALPEGVAPEVPAYMHFVPIAAVLLIFWVFFVLPTRKRQQKTQEMLSTLKSGDRVVMTCGLHGTIVGVEGDVVHLRIADKVKVEVDKASIAGARATRLTEEKAS